MRMKGKMGLGSVNDGGVLLPLLERADFFGLFRIGQPKYVPNPITHSFKINVFLLGKARGAPSPWP